MAFGKILGLITAWGAEVWIEPCIKQALEYCDEVIVVVTNHSAQLKQFEDGTANICKQYKEVKLLNVTTSQGSVSKGRCEILNYMLNYSDLYKVGNWVWMLDVDEFYDENSYKFIKTIINDGKWNRITVGERFFFIDMKHYLTGSHNRIYRIDEPTDRFKPTDHWGGKINKTYTTKLPLGMFHYSMLTDTKVHKVRWQTEYDGNAQNYKWQWLDKIYYPFDLENEDYWVEENRKLNNIKSPWFNKGFKPDKGGRLYKYDGPHPKFIEESKLWGVKDFRTYYT